ncbi:ABC transporter permease [Parapusillimonas granuli]|uniref:ABC transporter permease n=1 Tax=Parapusillimonas granuli TaxID=380911 RepID=A0A853G466_9BURK|nr:ABC transporter permease [Parapusillimonas granuli]MBB5215533.1 peptide/nickel transport system permease protein [Parapusillimonas granuli]NYT49800.1 ABC transporter permease [Parapusillimonas granuli]
MARLILSRLFQAFMTLLMTSLIVFVLARSSGSPADLVLPTDATPAERSAYIERMGLDKPMASQYMIFLRDALRGDFGTSIRTGAPATELVFDRVGRTLILATAGLAVALLISVPLGVLAAVHRGKGWDRFSMGFALLGQSTPAFWLGIVLILVFAVGLRWFPSSGVGTWQHYVLPSVVLGWSISAGIVRLLRSSMLEVLDAEFIKLARTKGLSEGIVVWKHGLRNALIPVVTFIGFMYGVIIASGVVIEVVFGWPGLGYLAYESTLWRDFPVLQLSVLVYTAIIVGINFLVDLSYGLIDPRVRG